MSLLLALLFLSSFPKIDQTIPDGPFSYPGKSIREVITVDPDNSPLLLKACRDLKKKLQHDILFETYLFIKENLFNTNSFNEENLKHLLQNFGNGKVDQDIPLEVFLQEKIGVCRHIALTTTYLLNFLVNEGILEGSAYLIRDETPFGRHAWTLFLSNDAAWHIDPYWGVFENGKTDAGFCHLCKKYGKKTMERQKLKWEDGN